MTSSAPSVAKLMDTEIVSSWPLYVLARYRFFSGDATCSVFVRGCVKGCSFLIFPIWIFIEFGE